MGWRWLWEKSGAVVKIPLLLLVLSTVVVHYPIKYLQKKYITEEIEPLLQITEKKRLKGDSVWVSPEIKSPAQWYSTCPRPSIDLGKDVYYAIIGEMPGPGAFRDAPSVWVLFGYFLNDGLLPNMSDKCRLNVADGYNIQYNSSARAGLCC